MTEQQSEIIAGILADAANPQIDRNHVLGRASRIGQALAGDERHRLVDDVYSAFSRRDAELEPGNRFFVVR